MADESNLLDRLVGQVHDNGLRRQLEREIQLLRDSRRFGLVFDRHLPESVRLLRYPLRPGVRVGLRDESSDTTWQVERFADPEHERVELSADGGTRFVHELVAVREFGERVYPGLESVGRLGGTGAGPWHPVIAGENFHVLQTLRGTHRGKVDLIYIDPPYNTGGKSSWLYNDRFVGSADRAKSSKWLSFMERRLEIARDLLKSSGVIIVSIGDDEQHRLRMLMDQIFGVENCVAVLTVEMSTTSGPKTTNAQQGTIVKNSEFALIYQRSDDFDDVPHQPLFDGVPEWDRHYSLWLNDDGTVTDLADAIAADPDVRADMERFGFLDKRGKFEGMRAMDRLLSVSEAARRFVLDHLSQIGRLDTPPVSCRGLDAPVRGWIQVQAESRTYILTRLRTGTLNQIYTLEPNYRLSDDYRPKFGRTVIRGDLWKGFHQDMGNIAREGGVPFSNGKKPIRLIKQLIRWANNDPDALVVDFFGGSGSTAHAVMEMNASDGGRRQCILVTNNEVGQEVANALRAKGLHPGDADWDGRGVFEAVTCPRITNVFEGMSQAEGSPSESLPNIEFFRLTYLDPSQVRRGKEFPQVAPLLWLEAGASGPRIEDTDERGWALTRSYGVLFKFDALPQFAVAVAEASSADAAPRVLFIVTDSPSEYEAAVERLSYDGDTVQLYEEYLSRYPINTESAVR